MSKKQKKKQKRQPVDHTKTLASDMKRLVFWVGISLGVTAILAAIMRTI
ncbi:hypothetical protein C8P63_10862 [Melghirimyces profundicolus]|uniref:Uncharacterized protein n=1 Tax=Melghirimyces profundicolus TaxID=1242148 RepID=A0A2T6BXE1_9BACL|nr:hypothetical protein [Melghirimyces profundicolus]PTX60752.1 hypothetical protein C8P63_10862 [Melghirimyces profundicolus]